MIDRPAARDVLVGAALVLIGVAEALFLRDEAYGPAAVQAGYAVAVGCAMVWRSSAPWISICLVAGSVVVMLPADGSTGGSLAVGFSLYLLLPFAVAMALRRRERVIGVVAVSLLGLGADLTSLRPDLASIVVDQIFIALGAAGGYMVGRREGRLRFVHDAAEARAQDAVEAERVRIARELHDIVGHGLTVMVVQADSARHALASDPAATRAALEAIERTGRESLGDMRRLLGLLRADGGPTSLAPQPGVDDLPALVDGLRDAGVSVDLRVQGDPVALSRGLGLAAYRIVQEALTNIVRHAGRAHGRVTLSYSHRALLIEVCDDGGSGSGEPGTGRGLVGIEERVRLYGGTVDVSASPKGWRVSAVLPLGGAA